MPAQASFGISVAFGFIAWGIMQRVKAEEPNHVDE